MKFFVDTADVAEIKDLAATGLLDGVTTNPSLVAKSGGDFKEIIKEICAIVPGPVSAEVAATDYDGMMKEAKVLAKNRQERHDQGAAHHGRAEGLQGADLGRHHGQRHAVLLRHASAAGRQGRRHVRLALHRPPGRHRAERHGSHQGDPHDLRQLPRSLDRHSRRLHPHHQPRERSGHDRRGRGDHPAVDFEAARQAPADRQGHRNLPRRLEKDRPEDRLIWRWLLLERARFAIGVNTPLALAKSGVVIPAGPRPQAGGRAGPRATDTNCFQILLFGRCGQSCVPALGPGSRARALARDDRHFCIAIVLSYYGAAGGNGLAPAGTAPGHT